MLLEIWSLTLNRYIAEFSANVEGLPGFQNCPAENFIRNESMPSGCYALHPIMSTFASASNCAAAKTISSWN